VRELELETGGDDWEKNIDDSKNRFRVYTIDTSFIVILYAFHYVTMPLARYNNIDIRKNPDVAG
jgi:hypothetical protein